MKNSINISPKIHHGTVWDFCIDSSVWRSRKLEGLFSLFLGWEGAGVCPSIHPRLCVHTSSRWCGSSVMCNSHRRANREMESQRQVLSVTAFLTACQDSLWGTNLIWKQYSFPNTKMSSVCCRPCADIRALDKWNCFTLRHTSEPSSILLLKDTLDTAIQSHLNQEFPTEEGSQNDYEVGAHFLQGKTKGAGTFQFRKEIVKKEHDRGL